MEYFKRNESQITRRKFPNGAKKGEVKYAEHNNKRKGEIEKGN